MKLTRRILTGACALLIAASSAIVLSGCSEKEETVADIAAVKAAGKLVVGITEYEPMDYKDENGEWTGFDAEFARLFAADLGVEVEFVEIDWDNKIFEVQSGAIDCIWNGMTITGEILESCSVSDPYIRNEQVIVRKADVAFEYSELSEMTGLTFAVEAGSAGESAIADTITNITAVATQADALLEVASGSADACVIDATMARAMVGDGTSYADLAEGITLTQEDYGVAFRKGSDLCDELNAFMDKIIADGSFQALGDKYGLSVVTE
ncbi:MAG: transporter substrate-binding domain-containing protein [Clostridia bacterium]|nr:transporter substrate-binding domain-containing protein [Clostridia bacterium]